MNLVLRFVFQKELPKVPINSSLSDIFSKYRLNYPRIRGFLGEYLHYFDRLGFVFKIHFSHFLYLKWFAKYLGAAIHH